MTDWKNAEDYFALFGLERRFEIDLERLQSRYLELARATHPDFAGADSEAQIRAMELSARVNEAHRVLADAELRGNYLLELLAGKSGREEKALPEGFLERIMELREEVQEAKQAENVEKVKQLAKEVEGLREQCVQEIGRLFAEKGKEMEIRRELNALRYINRLIEQAQ